MKKNILFLPHAPVTDSLINRVNELAINLDNKKYNCYFLKWETCTGCTISKKFLTQIKNLKTNSITKKDGVFYLRIPMLNFPPTTLLVRYLDSMVINYFIKKYKIYAVVNASTKFFDFKYISCKRKIYDVVDDHLSLNEGLDISHKTIELQNSNIENADMIITITELLEKKLNKLFPNKRISIIENGFYPEKFKQIKADETLALKKEIGIASFQKVIGYIGGIDKWVRLELALEAFLDVYKDSREAIFLVVGSGNKTYYEKIRKNYECQNIQFTGSIDKSIVYRYFKLLDVGVIPFELSDFTKNAFPIKTLEYGAAGAYVIASQLTFLLNLKLPFVHFFENDKDLSNLIKHTSRRDLTDNNNELEKYAWEIQSKKLELIISDK
jgi:glycosyltransferase involved in cell wall biosynthesis